MKTSVILASLLFLIPLSACSSPPAFDAVYKRLEEPELRADSDIPSPERDVILRISGKINNANQGAEILMDRPTLESVGLVEYSVKDPFEKEERTFTGVLMKDLLELWQVSPDASTLNVVALNDFQIDVPIDLVRDYPVMLALKQDGEYMDEAYRGPTMLVFPYGYYKFKAGTDSYWAWQIATITVE